MKIGIMRRSNEEYMLLILSFGGAIAIFPFCVTRLLQEEWLVGMVDLTLVVGMIALGALVYFTHDNQKKCGPAITLIVRCRYKLRLDEGLALNQFYLSPVNCRFHPEDSKPGIALPGLTSDGSLCRRFRQAQQ